MRLRIPLILICLLFIAGIAYSQDYPVTITNSLQDMGKQRHILVTARINPSQPAAEEFGVVNSEDFNLSLSPEAITKLAGEPLPFTKAYIEAHQKGLIGLPYQATDELQQIWGVDEACSSNWKGSLGQSWVAMGGIVFWVKGITAPIQINVPTSLYCATKENSGGGLFTADPSWITNEPLKNAFVISKNMTWERFSSTYKLADIYNGTVSMSDYGFDPITGTLTPFTAGNLSAMPPTGRSGWATRKEALTPYPMSQLLLTPEGPVFSMPLPTGYTIEIYRQASATYILSATVAAEKRAASLQMWFDLANMVNANLYDYACTPDFSTLRVMDSQGNVACQYLASSVATTYHFVVVPTTDPNPALTYGGVIDRERQAGEARLAEQRVQEVTLQAAAAREKQTQQIIGIIKTIAVLTVCSFLAWRIFVFARPRFSNWREKRQQQKLAAAQAHQQELEAAKALYEQQQLELEASQLAEAREIARQIVPRVTQLLNGISDFIHVWRGNYGELFLIRDQLLTASQQPDWIEVAKQFADVPRLQEVFPQYWPANAIVKAEAALKILLEYRNLLDLTNRTSWFVERCREQLNALTDFAAHNQLRTQLVAYGVNDSLLPPVRSERIQPPAVVRQQKTYRVTITNFTQEYGKGKAQTIEQLISLIAEAAGEIGISLKPNDPRVLAFLSAAVNARPDYAKPFLDLENGANRTLRLLRSRSRADSYWEAVIILDRDSNQGLLLHFAFEDEDELPWLAVLAIDTTEVLSIEQAQQTESVLLHAYTTGYGHADLLADIQRVLSVGLSSDNFQLLKNAVVQMQQDSKYVHLFATELGEWLIVGIGRKLLNNKRICLTDDAWLKYETEKFKPRMLGQKLLYFLAGQEDNWEGFTAEANSAIAVICRQRFPGYSGIISGRKSDLHRQLLRIQISVIGAEDDSGDSVAVIVITDNDHK